MCPKPNETRNALSKKSHVEELEGIPGLFKALTDEADEEGKWSIFTFPVDFDAALYGAKMDKDFKYYLSMFCNGCIIVICSSFWQLRGFRYHFRFGRSRIGCIVKRTRKYYYI